MSHLLSGAGTLKYALLKATAQKKHHTIYSAKCE